ncbi:MlaD family protein [Mycobacterium paraintracellulare]|uniref:MlaD family protein n=1 Tax=Mycobacterium paraintracellulare TaxID=1138383 RepID=UPI003891DB87
MPDLTARSARIGRTAAIGFLAVALTAVNASCAPHIESRSAEYCAMMPDAIGLYVGNPVTQMGYPIGHVKSVTPADSSVRVDFIVTEQRSFPRDVTAIIRSTSILADRSLELVGNLSAGPKLGPGQCISLSHSMTPKSLSEIIGSANKFVNSINPSGSTNIGDVVKGLDESIRGKGVGINKLLTTTSAVLDSPDQSISDIGSIIANLAQLTSTLREIREPLKQVLLDAQQTTPDLALVTKGTYQIIRSVLPILTMVADVERNLGDEVQFTLDATGMALRKASAHAPRLANLMNPVPWWINTIANHYNNRAITSIRYRPPLYRIRTPDGVALCNIMNASAPGSCANVQGTPYAVDVALLQYVLTEAAKR